MSNIVITKFSFTQVPVVQRAEGVPGAASVHLRGPLRQGYPLLPTQVCTLRSEATL